MAAATVEDLVLAAYAMSNKNRAGADATLATELLALFIRLQKRYFNVAARVNPIFFGKSAQMTLAAGKWPRPTDANSVYRLERDGTTTGGSGASGSEVALVPFDDRAAETSMGAVYTLGQAYYSAGNAKDPTGGTLVAFYSRKPSDPATYNASIDSDWPSDFNPVFIDEIAIYLANKAGRPNEAQAFQAALKDDVQLFVNHLEHADASERRRIGFIRRFPINTMVPVR